MGHSRTECPAFLIQIWTITFTLSQICSTQKFSLRNVFALKINVNQTFFNMIFISEKTSLRKMTPSWPVREEAPFWSKTSQQKGSKKVRFLALVYDAHTF